MATLHLDKLFHVLVVLGAAACADDDTSRRDPPVDAAPGSADATSSADAGAEGAACFCDVEACCDRGVSPPVVQDGFTCCWSTTCD